MNTLNGNKIVANFTQIIDSQAELILNHTAISRNIFELSGSLSCLLYVKAIAKPPHKWGITANVVARLKCQELPWVVVLLFDSHERGYLLSSADVDYYIKNVWPLANDGDYKPATGSYLAENRPFYSLNKFFSQLTTIIPKSTSIEEIIDDAKNEADQIRKQGKSESDAHNRLKKYVANHPNCVGLDEVSFMSIEYPFPSGDRVDVAFESFHNKWILVEIEIEGVVQNLIGLFQVVKYRALQNAVLLAKDLNGSVDGVLVAKSIPAEIKSLAEKFGIKTFEIVV